MNFRVRFGRERGDVVEEPARSAVAGEKHAAQHQAGDALAMPRGVRERERRSPRTAGDEPALDAEMLAQRLDVARSAHRCDCARSRRVACCGRSRAGRTGRCGSAARRRSRVGARCCPSPGRRAAARPVCRRRRRPARSRCGGRGRRRASRRRTPTTRILGSTGVSGGIDSMLPHPRQGSVGPAPAARLQKIARPESGLAAMRSASGRAHTRSRMEAGRTAGNAVEATRHSMAGGLSDREVSS